MKIGTEVRVIDATGSYGGKYCDLVGRVEGVYSGKCGNVAVRLVNMTNPNSAKGLFYFSESELAVVANPPIDNSLAKTQLNKRYGNPFTIKNVIFNPPAVIILWNDGSKTVVKSSRDDIFDPEKGLAMAISKKALGNQGNYYNTFKKYLPKEKFTPQTQFIFTQEEIKKLSHDEIVSMYDENDYRTVFMSESCYNEIYEI